MELPETETQAEHEITRLRAALTKIMELDIPRQRSTFWRADKSPSKHDTCPHGAWMYEDCANCIAEFAAEALENRPG